jgi:hypothetical protein
LFTITPNSGIANTLNNLTILGNGRVDLNNNHLFIDYGSGFDPIAQIAAFIRTGYNGGS